MRIKEVTYNVDTSKKINNISIIHLSDIHFSKGYNLKRLDLIYNLIKKENPKYVCITGDLMDAYDDGNDNNISRLFLDWIENISKLATIIIIPGNHDIKTEDKEWRDLDSICLLGLKKIKNVHLLINDLYYDNGICFMGYNVPIAYYIGDEIDHRLLYNDFKKVFPSISKHFYNILLIHTPIGLVESEILDYLKNVDLVLAGHTHGGLLPTWIPGNWGILSPHKRLFPKNVRGIIRNNNTSLIISGGIIKLSRLSGCILRNFNFLFAIDIVKINVRKRQKVL